MVMYDLTDYLKTDRPNKSYTKTVVIDFKEHLKNAVERISEELYLDYCKTIPEPKKRDEFFKKDGDLIKYLASLSRRIVIEMSTKTKHYIDYLDQTYRDYLVKRRVLNQRL